MPQNYDEDEHYLDPEDDDNLIIDSPSDKPYEVIENTEQSGLKFKQHDSTSRLSLDEDEDEYGDEDGSDAHLPPETLADFKSSFYYHFKALLREFFYPSLLPEDTENQKYLEVLADLAFSLHQIYSSIQANKDTKLEDIDAEVTQHLSDLHYQFEQVSEALMLKLHDLDPESKQNTNEDDERLKEL